MRALPATPKAMQQKSFRDLTLSPFSSLSSPSKSFSPESPLSPDRTEVFSCSRSPESSQSPESIYSNSSSGAEKTDFKLPFSTKSLSAKDTPQTPALEKVVDTDIDDNEEQAKKNQTDARATAVAMAEIPMLLRQIEAKKKRSYEIYASIIV